MTKRARARIYRQAAELVDQPGVYPPRIGMCGAIKIIINNMPSYQHGYFCDELFPEFSLFSPAPEEKFEERGFRAASYWYRFDYKYTPRVIVLLLCEQMCKS